MNDLEKAIKAIFVLTEKIDQLERSLSITQHYFEQAKKKSEEDDAKIAALENELEAAREGKDAPSAAPSECPRVPPHRRPSRVPTFKETRPATEKAEETR